MKKDRLFARLTKKSKAFNFGKDTAEVFDDMLMRSVPFYAETQRMIVEIAKSFAQPKSNIYDLGCSTGVTLSGLTRSIQDETVRIIGIDNSQAMLSKARINLRKKGYLNRCVLQKGDLNENIKFNNASVVIMNLTLQFVRPLHRDSLITDIYRGLRKNGCLILIEKVLGENLIFNQAFINLYYDFKRRHGYSELEIAQKREALENVLIPYRIRENLLLLNRNGFKDTDIFFKWYNFCGLLALKI